MLSKNSLRFFTSIFLNLAITVLFAGYLSAEVPKFINFQGKLTNKSGVPVTASYTMVFTIYDAETGGTSQWTETQSSVVVNNGIFNVILGSGSDGKPDTGDDVQISVSVFNDSQRWIGIKVGSDSEMTPRTKLASVPYAYTADNLNGVKAFAQLNGNSIRVFSGNPPTTWTDLDLSSVVGKNYALVYLKVTQDQSNIPTYYFRQNGETSNFGSGFPSVTVNSASPAYTIIPTDSNGVVEWKVGGSDYFYCYIDIIMFIK